jgi:hypothetical protein
VVAQIAGITQQHGVCHGCAAADFTVGVGIDSISSLQALDRCWCNVADVCEFGGATAALKKYFAIGFHLPDA